MAAMLGGFVNTGIVSYLQRMSSYSGPAVSRGCSNRLRDATNAQSVSRTLKNSDDANIDVELGRYIMSMKPDELASVL